MNYIEQARKLRPIVEQAVTSLDDRTASAAAILFPGLKENGAVVSAGTRINWNGTIKKATVDLWDTAENNPGNAPTLWQDIAYKDGYRMIPDTLTVATAFEKGECGWWNGVLYRSLADANVYTPVQCPQYWVKM